MRLKSVPKQCVNDRLRNGRTCLECYFSQVNEKNLWTGTQRCWDAGCIEADMPETETCTVTRFESHAPRGGINPMSAIAICNLSCGHGVTYDPCSADDRPSYCERCGRRIEWGNRA